MTTRKRENVGGRPRKFHESSRPVTVTLPDRTLELLRSVDSDRAVAIAKATDWVTRSRDYESSPVEIVEVERGCSVIIVGPCNSLRKISWLRLIEIAPSRFLIVLPTGTPLETLEVAVMDLIESMPAKEDYEIKLLTELRKCLTRHRRARTLSTAELLFLDTSA